MNECLPPIVDEHTRILILGSMPGEESLRLQQYYAHPQNHFWRLLGDILGEPLAVMPYPTRLRALLRQGIGLWDVYATCDREGSSDGTIRNATENDLQGLMRAHPKIGHLICNGKRALGIAEQQCADAEILAVPSTSPAYTLPYADKFGAWLHALNKAHGDASASPPGGAGSDYRK